MRKILALTIGFCMLIGTGIMPVSAEAVTLSFATAEETDSYLKANLEALGLGDYSVLYNQAFSDSERKTVYETVFEGAPDSGAQVVTLFKNGVSKAVTVDETIGEVILFENFEKTAGAGINGASPDIGTKNWTSQSTSAVTQIVSSEKALSGTKSFKTTGQTTGNVATSYIMDADSYVINLYVYDNATASAISNLTYDLVGGGTTLMVGYDISKSYNASWRGRAGSSTNITYTDVNGNAIPRKKGWNRVVINVSETGTKLYINGVLTKQSESLTALKSVTGFNIQQRSGWGDNSAYNIVYTDAVSVMKLESPVLSDLSLTQNSETAEITANVEYTDKSGQSPIYTASWYVEGELRETGSSLSFTPKAADSGKEIKAVVSARNIFGYETGTLEAVMTESALAPFVPPVLDRVEIGGTGVVGTEAEITYDYEAPKKEGESIYRWYVVEETGDRLISREKALDLGVYLLGKTIVGQVTPVDIDETKGETYRTDPLVVSAQPLDAFNSIETVTDGQIVLMEYAEDLGVDEEIGTLDSIEKINLCKALKTELPFESEQEIVAVINNFAGSEAKGEMEEFERIRWNFYNYGTVEGADLTNENYLEKLAAQDRVMDGYIATMPEGEIGFDMFSNKPFTEGEWSFNVYNSFRQLNTMAQITKTKGSRYYNDEYTINRIIEALRFLYENYYNETLLSYYYPDGLYGTRAHVDWAMIEFHAPRDVEAICSYYYEEMMRPENKELFDGLMKTIDTFTPNYNRATGGVAGSNGVDISWAVMMRAALIGNSDGKFEDAYKFHFNLFRYTNDTDGFHEADGSAPYHGNVPYTLSYNYSTWQSGIRNSYIFKGTEHDVGSAKTAMLLKMAYESIAPVIYKTQGFSMVKGRGPYADGNGGIGFVNHLAVLYEMAPDTEKPKLASYIKYYVNETKAYSEAVYINGISARAVTTVENIMADETVEAFVPDFTKVFARMARVVHLRPDYAIALAMNALDAKGTEIGSQENRRGYNYGVGMHYIYTKDGMFQYDKPYYATVDMYRLPGITIPRGSHNNGYNGSNLEGGAVADGRYAAIAYHPQTGTGEGTFSANKSYFMFDDETVCIGSEVRGTNGAVIESTVENRKLAEDNSNTVTVDGTATADTFIETKALNWAHISEPSGGLGYYFPDGQEYNLIREKRTGNLRDIEITESTVSTVYNRYFFTVYKDHGTNPTDGAYSYVILPDSTAEQVKAYSNNPAVEITDSNNGVHAVKHKTLGITAATFFNANGGATADGVIKTGAPASVIIKKISGGYEVSVADVTRKADRIAVSLKLPEIKGYTEENGIEALKNGEYIELYADTTDGYGLTKTITLTEEGTMEEVQNGIESFSVADIPATVDETAATITVSVSELLKPAVSYTLKSASATLDVAEGEKVQNGQVVTYTNGSFVKKYTLKITVVPFEGYKIPANAELVFSENCTDAAKWTLNGAKLTEGGYNFNGGTVTFNGKGQTASYTLPEEAQLGKNAIITLKFYSGAVNHNFRVGIQGQYFGGNYRLITNDKDYIVMTASGGYFYSGVPQSIGWHQLTTVIDGEGVISYYIDGNPVMNNGVQWKVKLAEGAAIETIDLQIPGWNSTTTGAAADIKVYRVNEVLKGDVDGNGKIAMADATKGLKIVAGTEAADNKTILAADIDGNGKVAVTDIVKIIKYIARLIPSL